MRVRGRWFPAAVLLPGVRRPWPRCYVLAADDGLHVFRRPAETADWSAPIHWAATVLPVTGRRAAVGFDVHTSKGLVVVTAGSGCRCGSLGRWSGPSWAREEHTRA